MRLSAAAVITVLGIILISRARKPIFLLYMNTKETRGVNSPIKVML